MRSDTVVPGDEERRSRVVQTGSRIGRIWRQLPGGMRRKAEVLTLLFPSLGNGRVPGTSLVDPGKAGDPRVSCPPALLYGFP